MNTVTGGLNEEERCKITSNTDDLFEVQIIEKKPCVYFSPDGASNEHNATVDYSLNSLPVATESMKRKRENTYVMAVTQSLSPDKAKQIKEEVLKMQRNRFKTTYPRKRKTAYENRKSRSDISSKTPPKKYLKPSASLNSLAKLPSNKIPNLIQTAGCSHQSEDTSPFCKPSLGHEIPGQANVEGEYGGSVVKTCLRKNVIKHSDSEKQLNKDSLICNVANSSTSNSIICIDLSDDDDDDAEIQKLPESKTLEKKEKMCLKEKVDINCKKVHDLNVSTSKCFNRSSTPDGPLNLSVKTNGKEQLLQSSNFSGDILCGISKNTNISVIKSHSSQCNAKSSKEEPSKMDCSSKFTGCISHINTPTVVAPVKTLNITEKKQGESEENTLDETIRMSQSIIQQPKKYAVSTKNGIELVMAAGGSGKKRSPRSRLGKNSPIKLMRSPYLKKIKSFQANKQKVRKNLNFAEPEQEESPIVSLQYTENYVQNFVKIIMEVLDNELNTKLFRDELGSVQAFTALEEDGKKLYLRMLGRKLKWHRVVDIKYEEISAIPQVFVQLECAGFVTSDLTQENLEVLLSLLKVQELREMCRAFKVRAAGNKPALIQSLLGHGKHQTSVGLASTSTVLRNAIREQLGHCIKLCVNHREAIQRLLTLFSITHQDNAADRELSRLLSLKYYVETKRVAYPSYQIQRTNSVFASRDDMLRYEAAEKLLNDLCEHTELKNWETVCSLGKEAQKCFRELLLDKQKSEVAYSLPLFLRRYSPGSVYAYTIMQAVEGFRKSKATIPDAVIALRELLNQHIYLPNYRGRWYDTLALILHSSLHNGREAAELIIEALNDAILNEEYRHSLSMRGIRLVKVLKGNCADLKLKLEHLLLQPLCEIPEVTIKAKALNSNFSGYKKVYIEEDAGDIMYSSVEELVIYRYRREFPEAIHGEGSTMTTLFGLLFWNIIYHEDVPDVFQSPYQIEPLDLSSGEFYTNRKEAIDMRLHELAEWSIEQLQWTVKEIYKQHDGENSVVNWNRFQNVNQIMNLIKCIGIKVLCRIMERFAKDYRNVRKGFPDLILWAPARSECLFVEVKGPKDRLSVCQKIWLNKLLEFGARAEVCHVQTTGSKSLKKDTGATSERNYSALENNEAESGLQ